MRTERLERGGERERDGPRWPWSERARSSTSVRRKRWDPRARPARASKSSRRRRGSWMTRQLKEKKRRQEKQRGWRERRRRRGGVEEEVEQLGHTQTHLALHSVGGRGS